MQPPISFQPPPPPVSPATAGASAAQQSAAGSQGSKPVEKPAQPDLITRYNLKDKVNASEASAESVDTPSGGKAWSSNREERQSLLQKRRDQMILEARKKMEAKMQSEKATSDN